MGSADEKTYTVLVTGFEPFLEKYTVNPSFEIVQTLPDSIPASTNCTVPVRVIRHPSPVKVVYDEVRQEVPKLLSKHLASIDMVLHIGMAVERSYYSIERYAHREGYHKRKDSSGKELEPDESAVKDTVCPARMSSSFDFLRLLADWQECALGTCQDEEVIHRRDLRRSDDAGHFLCDFIYFNSLSWFAARNNSIEDTGTTSRPVMFLHVPTDSDDGSIERGKIVTCALIQAMAKNLSSESSSSSSIKATANEHTPKEFYA